MSASRTRFYLDKQNKKWLGVCAGIADYMGWDVTLVRIGMVVITLAGAFPWSLLAYWAAAWVAKPKPYGLYSDKDEEQFWQGVRRSPARTTREVRGRLRDIDRRLADVELYYTSRNRSLADEIDSLR
ncbi:envelope stress response membrane protein PspC [Sphingomonas sp. MAH-20]|uniref:Envelope stress response membrane protein PspC n=1 Tax=Sphingomonas horti TaxID=2682842 RepID=A0A6I4J1F8_9SPHN|nr:MULTISPECIES: envelope stress response membrane protein PspC [Sphingomonas]MBA2919855.1 envelope stress response membrane protein PspC [Sphingomonas sp. CGMCC 1.13658]MVO78094.1 envelope stress response membrane protein PspC [Sphingomonas horti]